MGHMEGMLSPPQCLAIESHVRSCGRCRRFVQWYRRTPPILRDETAASTPARLGRRLRRALAAAGPAR